MVLCFTPIGMTFLIFLVNQMKDTNDVEETGGFFDLSYNFLFAI